MTQTDRENLAAAYCSAWKAVKGLPITVDVWPHGWFVVHASNHECPRRVRASKLINEIAILTRRLAQGDAAVVRRVSQEA